MTTTEYEIEAAGVTGVIRRYPEATQILYTQGALTGYPTQKKNLSLVYDEGVDIVYSLRNMSPARFREFSELLLLAAFQEAERYKEEKYRFAKFEVQLNRTAKGRKMINPRRTYTAAKHTDSDIMVYGARVVPIPEEIEKRPYLVNKVEEILNIPDSPSPGPYVNKQRPYKVLTLTISIRAGLNLRPDKW